MKRLNVETAAGGYPVFVGADLLTAAGPILKRAGFRSAPVVVSNSLVMRLHGEVLLASLEKSFGATPAIRIGDGERFKSQATLTKIYDRMFRAGADRHSWILAFGGGVVGDIAGFAAATFMRGIRYVGVPTTLLSQVDSSVGGKVAVNVRQGKNLIGAFHHPSAVLSDTSVLRTLARREVASGLYEVIKCGAIRSAALLQYIEKRRAAVMSCERSALERIVTEAVRIKAAVVAGDERERHERMVLNFGHTVGHALETATGYRRFRHGEAVAWGMIAAVEISSTLGTLRAAEAQRLIRLILSVEKLPSVKGVSAATLWRALRHDKKGHDGRIGMVLLDQLGKTRITDDIDQDYLRNFTARLIKCTAGRNG